MLHWAVTFLIIGLVAALLGVTGVAGTATYIAYVLFVIFVIVAIVSLVMGKRPPAYQEGRDARFFDRRGGSGEECG